MALWKEQSTPSGQAPPPATAAREPAATVALNTESARRKERPEPKESLIAGDLTIEGKIEGNGHVRLAGRFKGDVQVDGNLTIEPGAQLTGQVAARTVIVGGELHGNISGAARVEVLESGMVVGDVRAGVLTVAPGSRIRGQVECGWEEKSVKAAAVS